MCLCCVFGLEVVMMPKIKKLLESIALQFAILVVHFELCDVLREVGVTLQHLLSQGFHHTMQPKLNQGRKEKSFHHGI